MYTSFKSDIVMTGVSLTISSKARLNKNGDNELPCFSTVFTVKGDECSLSTRCLFCLLHTHFS